MKKQHYIYADNAATTQLAPEALKAMMPFLTEDYGNASGAYSFSRSARKALKESRETIASCIGATPEEIFFTSGGTECDNWVIKGHIPLGRIVTSKIEHHAILNSLGYTAFFSHGAAKLLPVDEKGVVSHSSLEAALSRKTSLVSIMLANNEIGTIEPVKELAYIAHQKGVKFHTDAVQAVGHIPIDINELGVDLLSASAHKFRGPKGIGFLFCRKDTPLNSFMNGGQQEYGLRSGTENIASIVGMATALMNCCENMKETTCKLNKMVSVFKEMIIGAIPEAVFNGDAYHRLPGHISLSIPGITGEGLLHFLDLKGIAVSTGAACNSKSTQISHVLKAIRLPISFAKGTVRITLGMDNKNEDVPIIANSIVDYCTKVKRK